MMITEDEIWRSLNEQGLKEMFRGEQGEVELSHMARLD